MLLFHKIYIKDVKLTISGNPVSFKLSLSTDATVFEIYV